MNYLSRFAKFFFQKHYPDFQDFAVVFPNQRAGLFFRKELAKQIRNPVWEPAIFSIEQFLAYTTSRLIPEPLPLIFELYHIYRSFKPTETLESFYSWGEQLIRDFEEIDEALVPIDLLFKNLKDLTQLELQFPFDDEQIQSLQEFWRQFSVEPLAEPQ
ncbi:MAG: PD-(D/E)XK nuclease family protein, partial [Bacteroidia bacterium]|nr:PD-(D/E)XK nuclease family protein [Bacteroidia bacterium]